MQFGGKYFIDKCMPMGCSISCSLLGKFSTFLDWLVKFRSGLDSLDQYLDDFIFMGSSNSGVCELLMHTFEHACIELGVTIAHEKTAGPTLCRHFWDLSLILNLW